MRLIRVFAPVVIMMSSAGLAYAGGGTALTYQGRLLVAVAGEPANGLFDVAFSLWDVTGLSWTETEVQNEAIPIHRT